MISARRHEPGDHGDDRRGRRADGRSHFASPAWSTNWNAASVGSRSLSFGESATTTSSAGRGCNRRCSRRCVPPT
jgi:hypothetical protein